MSMAADRYPHLLSPLKIGNIEVRNRVFQTAHVKAFDIDGMTNQRHIDYKVERARGGMGLMIAGNRLVHPTSTTGMRNFGWNFRKQIISRDRRLTDGVHEHGAKIFAQLNHFGLNATSTPMDDYRVLWGPSQVRSPATHELPKAMEKSDIEELKAWWVRSAAYCREAGFDGTEVHIGHSYLLHQFLTPLFNKRTDEYGGNMDNRLRLAMEVIEAVRAEVGRDFVVGVRIPVSDFVPGGLSAEDCIEVAKKLEASGMVDYINTTAGTYHSITYAIGPSDLPDGWLMEKTAQMKAAIKTIPVFLVGGMKDVNMAEDVIAEGKADLVAMTRAQITEPALVNKLKEGREDEIYHCIRCNQGCIGRIFQGQPVTCILNPAAGREGRFGSTTLRKAHKPRHYVVIGGGPAGMKAAEVLSERGHKVTLLEKESRLGGQVQMILRTPRRDTFGWIVHDLEVHMKKNGVDIRLNTEAGVDSVKALQPDGVIVATGSLPARDGFSSINPMVHELPGVRQDNVVTFYEVLNGTAEIGKRVLVLDDEGTRYTAGCTEVLLDRGHEVELATRHTSLFPMMAPTLDLPVLYRELYGKGLKSRTTTWVKGIEGNRVTLYSMFNGEEEVLEGVDTVVLSTGHKSENALYLKLREALPDIVVHGIGDCMAPRRLDHAIYEGMLAGRERFDNADRYIMPGELEQLQRFEQPSIPAEMEL